MLNNLCIDLVANMTLVFVWQGETNSEATAILFGEDPVSGMPFVYVLAVARGVRQCASEAWDLLFESDLFRMVAAATGLPPIADVWTRAFGTRFSRAVDVTGPKKVEVSGVDLLRWGRVTSRRDQPR